MKKIMEINQLKKLAAEKAVEEIQSGMIIGLGTGTTFQYALEKLSQKIKNNELKNIIGVSSSVQTEKEAVRLGIQIITLNELYLSEDEKSAKRAVDRRETEEVGKETVQSGKNSDKKKSSFRFTSPVSRLTLIDITIDGADEVDKHFNLIKGGGGALLREKILAQACKKFIVVVDESKLSKNLGEKFPVPVEVIKFAVNTEKLYLESLGAKVTIRKNADGSNYVTDENNFILDADFGVIKNVAKLAQLLDQRAGIVEHGLFIGMTGKLYCAMSNGEIIVRRLEARS